MMLKKLVRKTISLLAFLFSCILLYIFTILSDIYVDFLIFIHYNDEYHFILEGEHPCISRYFL